MCLYMDMSTDEPIVHNTAAVSEKVSSYIAQCPVLENGESTLNKLHSLTDVFNQTQSQLLWEEFSHTIINVKDDLYTTE